MISKITSFFHQRSMLKNMAVLTGGTALAQLIAFAASPILSRLYTEQEYGSYGIFTSIVSYALVVSCLRLDQAIVVPKSESEALSIAKWAVKINTVLLFIFTIVSFGLVFLFGFSYSFLLLSPTIYFMGMINIFNYFSSRKKLYKHNSRAKIITGLTLAVFSTLLGYFQFGEYGLIMGMFMGQLFGSIYLYYQFHSQISTAKNLLIWKDLVKKYKQFMFINTPNALLDLTESAGVVLLLGLFFDKSNVGFYFFAFRILKMPMSMIGSSIFQVFYRESSAYYVNGKPIFPLYKKILLQLTLLSLPFFIVLFFLGGEIFSFVFGENWEESGRYAALFAPWFWLNFIASSVSCIPIVVNKQNLAFIISIINTVIRVTITLVCGFYYDFEVLIYSLAVAQTIIMLLNNFWYYFIIKKYGSE